MKYLNILTIITNLAVFSNVLSSDPDWLINPDPYTSNIIIMDEQGTIELKNGLINRTFILKPNAATVSLKHLVTGEEFVRSIRAEAAVEINGMTFHIGGLIGQPVHNYLLPEWIDNMEADPLAFRYTGHTAGKTQERFPWKKRLDWMAQDLSWPPSGK
jgi:hypothetical protein